MLLIIIILCFILKNYGLYIMIVEEIIKINIFIILLFFICYE